MLKLTVYENNLVHSELELNQDEELTAGRSKKTDLVLSDEKVSREHCKIYYSADQWIIEDLDSKNGITINGERIMKQALANGDVVKIANFRIEVYLEELKPPPDEEETVIADDEECGEEVTASDDRTIQDIRKVSVPPPVDETPVVEEIPGEEESVPVHEKTEAMESLAEEPAPQEPEADEGGKDSTEILEEPAAVIVGKNRIELVEGRDQGNACVFDNHILVGRSTNCDMLIEDETVSREHITISLVKNKYVLTNLNKNNVTYLNSKMIKKANVKDGDIIKIGETTLKVKIFTGKKEKKKIAWKGIITVVAVIVLLAALLMVFLGRQKTVGKTTVKEQPEQAGMKNEKDIIETERDRERQRREAEKNRRAAYYMKEGEELLAKRNFSSALQRFSLVIEIDPENKRALDYIAQCRAKIEEARRIRVEAERKRKELEQKVGRLVSESKKLYENKEYKKARGKLIEASKLSSSNKEVSGLLSTVNTKIKKEEARIREERQRREDLLARVRKLHARGMEHYDNGDYYLALKEFHKVVSIDVGSSETGEARKLIPAITNMLSKRTSQYYDRGIEYYEQEDYSNALTMWQKVLDIDPEHSEAKKVISGLFLILDQKVKTLYHEGLVYEGIGKIDRAVKKWKEVIKTVPVKTNEYYQKAIGKLRKHGEG